MNASPQETPPDVTKFAYAAEFERQNKTNKKGGNGRSPTNPKQPNKRNRQSLLAVL